MAEEDWPEFRHVALVRRRPPLDRSPLFGTQLPCGPVDHVAKALRHLPDVTAGEMGHHQTVTVPVNETNGNLQRQQAVQRLAGHGPGQDVTADHNQINVRGADLSQRRLQREDVAVDVIQRSDSHLSSQLL